MGLCISGDLDIDEIVKVVDRLLPVSDSFSASEVTLPEPTNVNQRSISCKMPLGKPICSIGLKINDIPSDKRERLKQSAALDLFCRMVFSMSESFYLEMLDKKLISHNFDCGSSCTKTYSYISFSGESDDPEALMECIRQKLSEVKRASLDKVAFEREKRCNYAGFVSDFDSTEDIAFMLMSYSSGVDDMNIFEYLDIIESIELDYLEDLVKRIINEDDLALSAIYPS